MKKHNEWLAALQWGLIGAHAAILVNRLIIDRDATLKDYKGFKDNPSFYTALKLLYQIEVDAKDVSSIL